jgi:large-conductance mechanosensitive channel
MSTRLVALPASSCKKAIRVWSPRSTKNSLLDIGMTVMGAPLSKSRIGSVAAERSSTLAEAKKQGAVLAWGNFLTFAINFVIVAWVLFLIVKACLQ